MRLGLIAGNGRFPFLVLDAARSAGHDVTVVDRRSGPALETSFANAGGICPGFAGPWAAPGMPLKVLGWLFTRHAPFALRPRFDRQQWRWLALFLRNCSPERFAHNKARMQRIAHYSKACLGELRAETGIAFDHGTGGVLQLFRTEEELAGAEGSTRVLAQFNVEHRRSVALAHQRIADALCARDAEAAADAMRAHVCESGQYWHKTRGRLAKERVPWMSASPADGD